nr:FecR family protein [uncultured Bacteroides sp.]
MEKEKEIPVILSETSQRILKKCEPILSNKEKQKMWATIDRRTRHIPRYMQRSTWYVAASIAIVAIGSWVLLFNSPFTSNPYTRLSEMVNVDTLKSTQLYIENQQIELGEQVEIQCLPSTNQVEVSSPDGASFKLSVPSGKGTYMQLAVPKGKRAQVILADKSKITLRAQSKLIFPLHFIEKKREVKLEGEAYMQISRNEQQRFITQTNTMEICVLGTEFLVVAYPHSQEQSVVLVKGSVQITPQKGKAVTISPNQKYTYNSSTSKASLLSNVDATPMVSWKENLLIIQNQSLGEVLKTIEGYYNVSFSYNWNELQSIHITGKLDVSVSLNEILENLSKIAPIKIENNRKTIKIEETNLKEH